jgi:chemotaxis protein methyltransferase CheR
MPALAADEFKAFAELIHAESGIHLGEMKRELLRSRMGKRMRALGIDSPEAYRQFLLKDESGLETDRLVDVVTTNKTEFFREARHYEHLVNQALPAWLARRSGPEEPFRAWSAACSSGEEPYSMAMVLLESLAGKGSPKVLATDISSRMLHKGMAGLYTAERVGQVPRFLREKYFKELEQGGEAAYKVLPALGSAVTFSRFNLNDPGQYVFKNKFQAIFCRNVMIYFDRPTQEALVSRLSEHLAPGGFLYTGFSESLLGVRHGLRAMGASVYQQPL